MLTINYQWRRLIVSLLDEYLEGLIFDSGGSSEIDYYNQVRSLINDLYTANGATVSTFLEASRTIDQSLTPSAVNAIQFNTGDYDTNNVTRINIPHDGTWMITANCAFVTNGNKRVNMYIMVNGVAPFIAAEISPTLDGEAHSIARVIELVANDYVELIIVPSLAGVGFNHTVRSPVMSLASWD